MEAHHVAQSPGMHELYALMNIGIVVLAIFVLGRKSIPVLFRTRSQKTKESFTPDESERILRGFISIELFDSGIYCRTDDRGDPVIQVAPALIAGKQQFDEIEQIVRSVLIKASKMVNK